MMQQIGKGENKMLDHVYYVWEEEIKQRTLRWQKAGGSVESMLGPQSYTRNIIRLSKKILVL